MDAPQAVVRLSVVAAVASAGLLVWLAMSEAPVAASPVLAADGSPFMVPRQDGAYAAQWNGKPVLVFVVPQARLEAVDAARGEGAATPSIALDGGRAVFALSAKSTHMGCTVRLNPGLGASLDIADYDGDGAADGRILDPCHQGQWDAYNRGRHLIGPGNGPLAVLEISLWNGHLRATGFDGPVRPS